MNEFSVSVADFADAVEAALLAATDKSAVTRAVIDTARQSLVRWLAAATSRSPS